MFHGQSFQDMIAPLKEYREAYKEVEQAYDTVSQSTAGIRDLISPERDSATYERYMNYANRLNETVDDFAKGMSMGNRAALLGLKRDYASEIVPINTAIAKRNALADEQRETRRKDQTAIFQRDANTISLDRFMENPQTDYGGVIYGSVITEQARNMMKNLAKEIHDNPNNQRLKRLFPYTYEVITKKGYDSGTIYDYLMNGAGDNERKNILNEIINNVVSSSGVEGWNDSNATRQVWDYAAQSVWDSIGEPWARDAYDKYSSAAALAGLSSGSGSGTTTEEEGEILLNDKAIFTKDDEDALNKERTRVHELLKYEYIEKDPSTKKYKLTDKGKQRIKEVEEYPTVNDRDAIGYLYNHFKKEYEENSNSNNGNFDFDSALDKYLTDKGWNYDNPNSHIDLNRAIEYELPLNQADYKDIMNLINAAIRGKKVYEVKFSDDGNGGKGGFVNKRIIDWNDYYENGHPEAIQFSPYGTTITLSKGSEKDDFARIFFPASLGSGSIMNSIKEEEDAMGKILDMSQKNNIEEQEKEKGKKKYKEHAEKAARQLMEQFITNRTSEQKLL